MSGELKILLVVLLSMAVGAPAVIYCFRKRGRYPHAENSINLHGSILPDHDAAVLDDRRDESQVPEIGSRVEAAGTPHVSGEEAEKSATTADHEDVAILDEWASREEHRLRPDEGAEDGELTGAPHGQTRVVPPTADHVILPDSAAQEDRVADDGGERESTLPQAGSEEAKDSDSFPELSEIDEEQGVSRGEEEREQAQQVPHGSEDSADLPPQWAKTTATAGAEKSDRAPEEDSGARATDPDEEKGAVGVVAAVSLKPTLDFEEPPGSTAEGDGRDVDPASITQPHGKKKPRKYKPLERTAPQPHDADPQSTLAEGEGRAQRERSLPIEVRLRFDRGGFCSVSLIAKRSSGLPEDLTVVASAGEVNLRAMQDEWYQDVVPDEISRVLRGGIVWTQEGASGQCTWSVSGRDLYVLGDRPDISGYVSQPCLDLGRDHVVLCIQSLRSRVEEAIRDTGAQPTTVLDESFGAPAGWVVFRGVVPNAPVVPTGDDSIFNALKPRPRIDISLERGIRLRHANWLDGHPPSIRVYGDPEHASEVRIDGQVAECVADGAYRASGWDSVGPHSVWCAGSSRSYSITPFGASWELWDAYAFPVALGGTERLAVCGPIVRGVGTESWGSRASFAVPDTNPVLLGPEPGQIVTAVKASSLRSPRIASPCFRPVWALPHDPLHCDKENVRILLVAGSEAPEATKEPAGRQDSGAGIDVDRWCRLILDANRKRMATDPDTESVRAQWRTHQCLARRIWRSRR